MSNQDIRDRRLILVEKRKELLSKQQLLIERIKKGKCDNDSSHLWESTGYSRELEQFWSYPQHSDNAKCVMVDFNLVTMQCAICGKKQQYVKGYSQRKY